MAQMCFYFLPIILLLLSCFKVVSVVSLTTDQSALLAFKSHINTFDPQNTLRYNWSTSISVCHWIGVSCGARHKRVTALDLSNMGLGGTIPPDLGNLAFLVSLNLSQNNFNGHLPIELGQLRCLKFINLNYNYLSGKIPSWFGYFPHLQHLGLRNNNFTGTIPLVIYNMSTLQHVDLSYNDLSGTLSDDMCNFLRKLEWLSFSANKLYGQLPSSLGKCNELQILGLYINKFTGQIPKNIGNLTKLKEIYLGGTNLEGEIPQEMGNLFGLEMLFAENIGLTGPIPPAIFNISSLKQIRLHNNSLSGSIPDDMCNHLPKLELLYLYKNELYDQLPSSLGKCSELRNLGFGVNKFTGGIPRNIRNLTKLKELNLESTNLEGEIPWEIGKLMILEIFSAQYTDLSGPIPPTLFNISSLKEIHLGHNSLSGKIPWEIGKLMSLEIFSAQSTDLSGPIPPTFFNISSLKEIRLGHNSLTGEIPWEIGKLMSLEIFSAYEADLSGPIPLTLFNISSLKEIHLGHNSLSGEIPQQIGNLHNLVNLWMAFNYLTGLIPSTLFNISTIEMIGMHFNNLSGHLPSNIGVWVPNLQVIYLSENDLSGIIPNSISNASNLRSLDFQLNSFSGPIPNTLGNLRLLQWLGLGGNNLTTKSCAHEWNFFSSLANCKDLRVLGIEKNPLDIIFPMSVGNISVSLEKFYASDCKINGHIPKEFGNLSNLITLSLYGNNLQGFIPYDLCHLKMLDQLMLSFNKLHGPIPTCLYNLTSLHYLDLSSNNLSSTLPPTLWSLTDILEVNLSFNSLNGFVPQEVGNLKHLITLDLSSNQLYGNLPSSLGGLKDLQYLLLEGNGLQGPIPQSFGDLISLVALDLSHNILSGVIPKSMEALIILKQFNVSSNRLEGEIPTEGPFRNFSAQSFLGNNALCGLTRLQVPPCKSTFQRSKMTTISSLVLKYIFPIVASIILAMAFAIILIRRLQQNANMSNQVSLLPLAEWRRISYLEIQQATDGFSDRNLLGIGGFGSVYKGPLSDGMVVAIKVFKLELEGALKSFNVECEVIRNIRHRNIVKIISICCNLNFKALLLEFIPNGNLEKWLYSHNYFLDILQRLDIMIDVASALEYLHHGNSTSVVHCDLKPCNVLLDEDMVAHVADFGIAKLLGEGESLKQTVTMATVGYMAPEYGSVGIVSMKSDVYSFGILLMETFTRKKPTDEIFDGDMSLRNWVKLSLSHANTEVVDVNLLRREEKNFRTKMNCISSVLGLALDCSTNSPQERGNMTDVLAMLKRIRQKLLKELNMRNPI